MTFTCYVPKKFTKAHERTINRANQIINHYAEQGFDALTLRQTFYRFVAQAWLKNTQKNYKWLGGVLADARLAGRIDWSRMEDRTRHVRSLQHFSGPQDALNKLKEWYHVDMWAGQEWRPIVYLEKDALLGVIQRVCEENDVPYFSCRGYVSLSEMWRHSLRIRNHLEAGQKPYIIHFGDHDPSGIDMSRDICDRLQKTFLADCEFKRVALNMDQVREFNPPPNPAKVQDSRYEAYVKKFGDESWELDALEPPVFRELIEAELVRIRNQDQWDRDAAEKERVRKQLVVVAETWERIEPDRRRLKELDKKVSDLKFDLTQLKTRIKAKIARDKKRRKKDG